MADTDRTQWKKTVVGVLGASRSVTNADSVVAQEAQRFAAFHVTAATTAGTDYTWPLARNDRPVKVIEVRILPGGTLTSDATNYATINYGYTNDASGTVTSLGTCNTAPVANGGTGNWALGSSLAIPAVAATSTQIASANQLVVTSTHAGIGVAIPAFTRFQMIWEEV